MIVEFHVLQNVAPANLNRDDTGAPKDCIFGGVRRARVSSQSWKRAMRIAFADEALLPAERLGARTTRAAALIAERLVDTGEPADTATSLATAALQAAGLGVANELTEYLLFLGSDEIDGFAKVARDHRDALLGAGGVGGAGKAGKKAAKQAIPDAVQAAARSALDGGRAADVALFGRMLADLPQHNVDGAAQVAHAISTHGVEIEFDFYTAVDDRRPEDTEGAGMLGTVEFVSSCLYRYANVDLRQLAHNLQGDSDLVEATLRAFARVFVTSMPSGKQRTMAARNPPSAVVAVVRDRGAWSLANAFVAPVRSTRDADLVAASAAALGDYWTRLTGMYGMGGIAATPLLCDRTLAAGLTPFGSTCGSLDGWVDEVARAAGAGGAV